jgi:Leucine-rich repeat (LRR) protein
MMPHSLPSLEFIMLSNLKISTLTGFPSSCPKLTELCLHHHKALTNLKDFPCNLPSLKKLDLQSNALKNLEYFPLTLPNLEILKISVNPLQSLFGLPSSLKRLHTLELESTRLTELTGFPKEIPNLQYLYLQESKLKSFIGLPEDLSQLETLLASHNKLSSLQGLPHSLPNLVTLRLDYNKFHNLTHFPTSTPKLENLSLGYNDLESLEGLPDLPNIEEISVDGNPIRTLSYLSIGNLIAVAKTICRTMREYDVYLTEFEENQDFDNHSKKKKRKNHPFDLSAEGFRLIEKSFDWSYYYNPKFIRRLYHYYRIPPEELARRYVANSYVGDGYDSDSPLSKKELSRLHHEGSYKERKILEDAGLPKKHWILHAISNRLSIRLPNGHRIMK